MTTDTATITITPVIGDPDALLHVYGNEQAPQECYIELDLEYGTLSADYNPEIGDAAPSRVWHGTVRRYPIPVLQPATVNALMEEIAPIAATIVAHATVEWDGSNHVGTLDTVGGEAEESLEWLCEEEPNVFWWDAGEWPNQILQEVRQQLRDGATIDALYDEYQGDGSSEDHPVVIGLWPYLEDLRGEVATQ